MVVMANYRRPLTLKGFDIALLKLNERLFGGFLLGLFLAFALSLTEHVAPHGDFGYKPFFVIDQARSRTRDDKPAACERAFG